MQKFNYILLLLMVGLSFTSCKKEMMSYEGMEGVYFGVQYGDGNNPNTWPYHSFTNVEFVKQPLSVKELTVNLKVAITGNVKDYDRTFRVEINPDSTTGIEGLHYAAINDTYTIPANATFAYVPVVVKRAPDLATQTKKIGLRLLANENFGLAFPDWKFIPGLGLTSLGSDTAFDATLHMINISDMMVQPAIWRGSVAAATKKEGGAWGAFSRRKIELMFQLIGLTYEDFSSETTMPLVLVSLVTTEMKRYLQAQFDAGNLIKEDDGRLMWVEGVTWTSVVGVPY